MENSAEFQGEVLVCQNAIELLDALLLGDVVDMQEDLGSHGISERVMHIPT